MALWLRDRAEQPTGPELVHRGDARSPYTSLSFTAPLVGAGIDASIGIVGDLDHSVVVPLDGIRLLTDVKVLIADVEGQAAYMPGGRMNKKSLVMAAVFIALLSSLLGA